MASPNVVSKVRIVAAATEMVQSHGYSGLNFRELADIVGIRSASIYHHFPSKSALAAAVANQYWRDSQSELESISTGTDASASLKKYPSTFRRALLNENRICLASYLAAERSDIPEQVLVEVHKFADVNIAWLTRMLKSTGIAEESCKPRACAIFAAIAGAQIVARSQGDVAIFDSIVANYQASGLLPQ